MRTFRAYEEFEQYLPASEAQRALRWLYERSLASTDKTVELAGTCGLCLQPTRFTSATQSGEPAPGGRVPNWREGQACGCHFRLINRERALLHYLLSASLLRPWTRVLALGDTMALRPALSKYSAQVEFRPDPLAEVDVAAADRGRFHVVLSVEQLTARRAQPDVLGRLAAVLTPGGTIAFTAPFAVAPGLVDAATEGPIGWAVLDALAESGFTSPRVCLYWSEEFGYLGAFNFIVTASKG